MESRITLLAKDVIAQDYSMIGDSMVKDVSPFTQYARTKFRVNTF